MIASNNYLTLLLGMGILLGCTETATEPRKEALTPEPATTTTGLGSWTTRASMPTPRRDLAAAVVPNAAGQSILYAIGGRNFSVTGTGGDNPALKRVEAYNAATNIWTRRASLPSKRVQMNGAGVINGKIYVTGGFDSSGVSTKTLYVYNPGTDVWTRKADLPVASSNGVTGVIGGKLYVLTGVCPACTNLLSRRLYRYDPQTNTWTRMADAPHSHVAGIAGVIDGRLYVDWGRSFTTDAYDPASNKWTSKVTQIYGGTGSVCDDTLISCTVVDAAAAVLNKRLYVIGGQNDDESTSQTFAYATATNVWTEKASMRFSREGPAAGKVKNGAGQLQIIVVGGYSNDLGQFITATEAFTP